VDDNSIDEANEDDDNDDVDTVQKKVCITSKNQFSNHVLLFLFTVMPPPHYFVYLSKTPEENLILSKSFVLVGNSSIVGTDQRATQF
jgi:hypothetical protein